MTNSLTRQVDLTVPLGKGGTFTLDMTAIQTAESRISEVAFVTPHKAPELLAVFNEVFLELTRYITKVEYEKGIAERTANKIKAVILLDRVPAILKERGLSTSADLRNAVLDLDDDYNMALDKCDQLEAMSRLLKGKLDAIEMAYNSVKKIVGENAYNMNNRNLKHGDETGFGQDINAYRKGES